MSRPRPGGFTLIELLVVVVVIGLAAALVYAQIESNPRQTIEREGRRLAGALEHAALLAQWQNQTLGVSAADGAYRFWRRTPTAEGDRWTALSDDEVLAPRRLPAPLAVYPLTYAGRSIAAGVVIPLAPSGRNEPYVIELAAPEWQLVLSADPLNRVALLGPSPR